MSSGILNVGICTVDAIARHVDQMPPPGGLRFFDDLTLTTGGCAANCAVTLARMGVDSRVITKVGDDILGQFVMDRMRSLGIDVSGVVRGKTTPFTFVCVQEDGQRSFIHTTGTNATLCLDDIDLAAVRAARFCLVTGAMIMPTLDGEQTAALLQIAREAGAVTLLDTVYTDSVDQATWQATMYPALPYVDYFVPSEPEAQAMTGQCDPSSMAKALADQGCGQVVIKLGHRGAFCRAADGTEQLLPAYRVAEVVDTTGAGDAWVAGFMAGLAEGESMAGAAALGNATAAQCIQAVGAGAGVGSLAEIRRFQETGDTVG